MKLLLKIIFVLALTLSSFVAGFFAALYMDSHAIEEFKMCHVNLTTHCSTNLTPQTREYLKERLYWNAAVLIPAGFFPDYQFDFGPVDESALNGITGIKDCSTSQDVYEYAMEKHHQRNTNSP